MVLARTNLADDFVTPDCPRWQISGQGDLADLGVRVWDTTSLHRNDARPPDADDVALIREILIGRSLPARDPVAVAEERQSLADRLTMEQAELLLVTRLLNRVEIRGGAGSGKTCWRSGRRPIWPADEQSTRSLAKGSAGSGSRWSATATAWRTTCGGRC